MLRTSVTKLRSACSLTRILRDNGWCSANSLEKLSAILSRYKSTTSGSKDDEEKTEQKCKRLIELAFGPDKLDATERIEKIDVHKTGELESMISSGIENKGAEHENVLNATKVEHEEQNFEKRYDTPFLSDDVNMSEEAKSEKCKKIIELVFGPSKPENVDSKVSKMPELETENIAQMVTPKLTSSELENRNHGIANEEINSKADIKNVLNATKMEEDEKLIQKIEKIDETPLVDADINKSTFMCSNSKFDDSKCQNINRRGRKLEELAIRCLTSKSDNIDSNVLKEMKRLGISQPTLDDLPREKTINIQKSDCNLKETRRESDKSRHINMSRRSPANKRAMKYLAMRMGPDLVTDLMSTDDKQKGNVKTSFKKDFSTKPKVNNKIKNKSNVETFVKGKPEVAFDRENSLDKPENLAINIVQNEVEKLSTERPEFQHERLINCSEDYESIKRENAEKQKEKEKEKRKSTELIDDKIRDEPAVLIKESDDPDGFLITPNTPVAETLTNRLSTLNKEIEYTNYMNECMQRQQNEFEEREKATALAAKEAENEEFLKNIDKLFNEERIPRHLFAELAVLNNLPTDTKLGKKIKDFFEYNEEKETSQLIKPERLRYYSHNDEVLTFRDCSNEVDPHVVIKEEFDEPDNTDTDTQNNYSNYYNLYQQNMYKQNSDGNKLTENSGSSQTQYMNYYNRLAEHSVMSYNNQLNSTFPKHLMQPTWSNNISTDSSATDHRDNLYQHRVIIEPYGKRMKQEEWETEDGNELKETEIETMTSQRIYTKESSAYSNLTATPLMASPYAVNDGTLESGSGPKDNKIEQKSNNVHNISCGTCGTGHPFIDKGAITARSTKNDVYIDAHEPVKIPGIAENNETEPIKCNAYVGDHEPVKITPMPVITRKEETLSEMLRRVRQRAKLEASRQQEIMIAGPVTEVDTTEGSCKKPNPPCPPPQKTCPPTPPKCPPSNCPEPKPPCPKPCKPACPDPCSTPKCPPAPKKDPCAKCVNKKPVDILGLVVTLGTLDVPQTSMANKVIDDKNIIIPLLVENVLLKLYDMTDNVLLREILKKKMMEGKQEVCLADLDRSYYFPKDYEPWTPIPSWPIPPKRVKKQLICPKDGCRTPPPPPPGAPCNKIHHPCSGFPNDKKRT